MEIYKLIYLNEDIGEKSINKFIFSNEVEGPIHFKKSNEHFVKKNNYKYKIIYKNKIYPLQNISEIVYKKSEIIKIKLICYIHISDILKISGDLKSFNYYEIEKFKKI